ncbi:MAG TPA: LysR family transcriptional regulator [Solirubrobacteraceae bacterium]|nr:LysR family transcriptional regulator [Solirubrobacteraceae bacterium]
MDLRLLRFVVVVAEERHFGRAAERVHLTQSGLSQAVQRLERELGFEVFHRSSRSVELTEAGRAFLQDATTLLTSADQMVQRARAISEGRIGELHVGYSPSIRVTAARVLADFARRRPGLDVTHRQEYTYPLITAVRSGSVDAAISISQELPDDLVAEPFADIPLVCLVPETHPLARRERATLAEIAAHEVAAVDGPSLGFWRRFLSELFASEDLTPSFVSEPDPVGGDLPMPRRGPLWLVPAELSTHPDHEIVLDPPRYVSFDLICRRDAESPALSRLRGDVAATRGDMPAATPAGHPAPPTAQSAVNSAGSRSHGRRAPAPARIGRG